MQAVSVGVAELPVPLHSGSAAGGFATKDDMAPPLLLRPI